MPSHSPGENKTATDPPPHCSIHGKVVNASNSQPLGAVPILIAGDGNNLTVLSGAGGEFGARDLRPGVIEVSTTSRNFPGVLGINLGFAVLALKPGEDRSDVTLKLSLPGSISGTIRNDRSQPVPGCNVQAFPNASSLAGERPASAYATSNDKGEYRLEGLSANRYRVRLA